MRFFMLSELGDDQNRDLAFVDAEPDGLEGYDFCLARGERIGQHFPEDAEIHLQPESPGLKLCSLLGNCLGYLIVNTEMKDVILEHCDEEQFEILPFTLFNHKKRVHSKDYWIVNPLVFLDCLDKDASDIEYLDDSKTEVVDVHRVVFDTEKLENAPQMFRIPEDAERYFIGQSLAKAFKDHGCSNIFLDEIDQD